MTPFLSDSLYLVVRTQTVTSGALLLLVTVQFSIVRLYRFLTPLTVEECSIAMSVSVCLRVCVYVCLSTSICPELHAPSSPNFTHFTYDRGSVLSSSESSET